MNTIQSINLIATNPQIRDNRPHILGTTLTVADIAVAKIYHGLDADGIADYYDISLPQVYAALAYYYDHKAEVDDDLHERRRLAEELKAQHVGSRHSPLFG